MASGSNAPFSGEFVDLENVPTLPEGVTASEATEKAKPDGTSIKTNSNGDLAVNKPQQTVIGDFENNLGNWNKAGNGTISRTTNKSSRGDSSVKLEAVNSSSRQKAILERTVDFSGKDLLKVDLNITTSESSSRFLINIGGNQILRKDGGTNGFVTIDVDASGITGSNKIEFVSFDSFQFNPKRVTAFVDNIRFKKQIRTKFNGAGN